MARAVPKTQSLQQGGAFETIVSGLVVLVAVSFIVFMIVRTGTGHLGSYPLRVRVADATGLTVGSGVRVGGVKVGSVSGLFLDPKTYGATVQIRMRDDLSLPADSVAAVASSVMGETYLSIAVGHAARSVPPDGTFGQAPQR
jgi:phospholipid/cholesterol/gamma-HCH transport system substrate-binding protein